MSERAQWGNTQDQPILGLTLVQPWAYVVVHHDKRIENRPWKPPKWAIGKRLAIHAGKRYDEETAATLWTHFRISVPARRSIALGAVIGTALLTGYLVGDIGVSHDPKQPCPPDQVRWFFGPYGWQLADVRAFPEPIPCAGALGLWRLPPSVLEQVLAA